MSGATSAIARRTKCALWAYLSVSRKMEAIWASVLVTEKTGNSLFTVDYRFPYLLRMYITFSVPTAVHI